MACSFPPPSTALRPQPVEAAARNRIPVQRPRGHHRCKAARREGATEDPTLSVSSARAQLGLLEQLTSSPTPDGIGRENGTTPTESRKRITIREQLSALIGDRDGDFTLTLGKRLKEGLKSLNSLTISQRRNIKRQALLNKVSGRNDSVFFATVGAFVIVPPLAILAVAVLTGYVQLLP